MIDRCGNEEYLSYSPPVRTMCDMKERTGIQWYNETLEECLQRELQGTISFVGDNKNKRADCTLIYSWLHTKPDNNTTNKNECEQVVCSTSNTTSPPKGQKRKKKDNSIYVTRFNPKSIEYIKKRSGETIRTKKKEIKEKNNKSNGKKKKESNEQMNYSLCSSITLPKIIFPDIWKLLHENSQKNVDFTNSVCWLLKVKGKEYKSLLHYTKENIGVKECSKEYWTVRLKNDTLGINMSSYDDVEFCFSSNNACTKNNIKNKYLYRTKEHALIHLELKLILTYKPSMLLSWMTYKSNLIPRVITPNCFKSKFKKVRNVTDETNHDFDMINGWICLFPSFDQIFAINMTKMRFDFDSGRYLENEYSSDELHRIL